MSITVLPNGRLRAQVYDPVTGKNVSVAKVLNLPRHQATWPNTKQGRRDAAKARELARDRLASGVRGVPTVADWHHRWLNDKQWQRPKESTMIRYREQTRAFVKRYGTLTLDQVDDDIVSAWLAGGERNSHVKGLRVMWNDAMKPLAGRLVVRNPWANLGIRETRGNRDKQPPAEELVWKMIAAARSQTSPFYAAWLQTACFTGMRPGELDALRWENVDFTAGRIRVVEQFNSTTRTVTLPKNGQARVALLSPSARSALLALPRDTDHVFLNLRGQHFTPSARAYHWKAVKAAVGWTESLYLATRHFAGWYMINELELSSEDVAVALGHTDGGDLVRKLYGHLDRKRALARVADAFENRGNVRLLKVAENA